MDKLLENILPSIQNVFDKILSGIPIIGSALLILLAGWIIAKTLAIVTKKLLTVVKFDDLCEKINLQDHLSKANFNLTPTILLSKFIYWIVILMTVISVSDSLGWNSVSNEISKIIAFFPKILVASIIFFLGSFIARMVRNIINGASESLGIGAGKILGSLVYYIILIMIILTSLEQLGIDTTLISSNLLLIMGLILGSAAISYGFASRKMLSNILGSFYSKKSLQVGQNIIIGEINGEILEISNLNIKIKTNQGIVLVPSSRVFDENITIQEK